MALVLESHSHLQPWPFKIQAQVNIHRSPEAANIEHPLFPSQTCYMTLLFVLRPLLSLCAQRMRVGIKPSQTLNFIYSLIVISWTPEHCYIYDRKTGQWSHGVVCSEFLGSYCQDSCEYIWSPPPISQPRNKCNSNWFWLLAEIKVGTIYSI